MSNFFDAFQSTQLFAGIHRKIQCQHLLKIRAGCEKDVNGIRFSIELQGDDGKPPARTAGKARQSSPPNSLYENQMAN